MAIQTLCQQRDLKRPCILALSTTADGHASVSESMKFEADGETGCKLGSENERYQRKRDAPMEKGKAHAVPSKKIRGT